MSEIVNIEYERPFLYSYQKEIVDSPARFTICEAATKCGKTASHIVWIFEQALKCKANQSCWWVAPTIVQSTIAYNRMKHQLNDKTFIKTNDTKRIITLITGAKIEFKTASDADSLYGDDVYAFVFDEFTRAKESAWVALRTTITSTGGKGKFIGNVKGKKNWGHKLAMRAKAAMNDKDYAYFKITAYDAAAAGMKTKDGRPFIEEIEAAKRDLPESVFKELYLAEASEDGSNPFGIDFIKQCTYPLSQRPSICYGIDLAKKVDWFVTIGLDQFGQTSYFTRCQKDWRQTKQDILSLPKGSIAIDSTGVGDPIAEDIQSKRDDVESFVFTQASKQQLMLGLAYAIQNRLINFPEGMITHELEQFEFVHTRTGVKYSAPDGETDDCVMALALAWHKYKQSSQYADGPSVH